MLCHLHVVNDGGGPPSKRCARQTDDVTTPCYEGSVSHHDTVTVDSDTSDTALSVDDVTNDRSSDENSGCNEAKYDRSNTQSAADNSVSSPAPKTSQA